MTLQALKNITADSNEAVAISGGDRTPNFQKLRATPILGPQDLARHGRIEHRYNGANQAFDPRAAHLEVKWFKKTTEKGEEKEEEYLGSFKAHQRKRRVQNPNPRRHPIAKVEGRGEEGENVEQSTYDEMLQMGCALVEIWW